MHAQVRHCISHAEEYMLLIIIVLVIHAQILAAGEHEGAIIATNQQCELCRLTMEIFVTVGNLTTELMTLL